MMIASIRKRLPTEIVMNNVTTGDKSMNKILLSANNIIDLTIL
jgi:hypothetical protein